MAFPLVSITWVHQLAEGFSLGIYHMGLPNSSFPILKMLSHYVNIVHFLRPNLTGRRVTVFNGQVIERMFQQLICLHPK